MDTIQIIVYAIISVILIIIVKEYSSQQALMMRIATCIMILFLIFSKFEIIKEFISEFQKFNFQNNIYLEIIMKIIAIAYLVEIAAEISKDAGENTIASNIMLTGKILIVYTSSPILKVFITQMSQILS